MYEKLFFIFAFFFSSTLFSEEQKNWLLFVHDETQKVFILVDPLWRILNFKCIQNNQEFDYNDEDKDGLILIIGVTPISVLWLRSNSGTALLVQGNTGKIENLQDIKQGIVDRDPKIKIASLMCTASQGEKIAKNDFSSTLFFNYLIQTINKNDVGPLDVP